MDNVINWIRNIQRNKLFYVLSLIQFIFLLIYFHMHKVLNKPIEFSNLKEFLFASSKENLISIIIGIIAWIISIILIVSIILEIPFVKDSLDFRNNYYRRKALDNLDKNVYIGNIVISIILFLGNFVYFYYLFEITLISMVALIILFSLLINS